MEKKLVPFLPPRAPSNKLKWTAVSDPFTFGIKHTELHAQKLDLSQMIQVDSKASKRMNDTAATSAFEGSFAAAVFGGSSTAATPFGALTASSASSPAATTTSLFSTAFTTDASLSSSSTTPFSAFAKPSAPATSVATTTSSSSSGFSLGTSFHGPLMAAKKATEDIGSSFIVIESFLGNCFSGSNDSNSGEVDSGSRFQGLVSSLVPQQQGNGASLALKKFSLNNDVRMLVKGLYGYMDPLLLGDKKSGSISKVEIQPTTIYPLLEDLHSIFSDLPSMGKALAHVQKMLLDVNRGEVLDAYAVFDNIIHKDVVSWNAMIAGLVENGLTEDAFSLFSLMVKGPTQPNSAFMNDWKPWMHLLQKNVLLKFYLVSVFKGLEVSGRNLYAQKIFKEMSKKKVVISLLIPFLLVEFFAWFQVDIG